MSLELVLPTLSEPQYCVFTSLQYVVVKTKNKNNVGFRLFFILDFLTCLASKPKEVPCKLIKIMQGQH